MQTRRPLIALIDNRPGRPQQLARKVRVAFNASVSIINPERMTQRILHRRDPDIVIADWKSWKICVELPLCRNAQLKLPFWQPPHYLVLSAYVGTDQIAEVSRYPGSDVIPAAPLRFNALLNRIAFILNDENILLSKIDDEIRNKEKTILLNSCPSLKRRLSAA